MTEQKFNQILHRDRSQPTDVTDENKNVVLADTYVLVINTDNSKDMYIGASADKIQAKYKRLQTSKRAQFELAPWEVRPETIVLKESAPPLNAETDVVKRIRNGQPVDGRTVPDQIANCNYHWVD